MYSKNELKSISKITMSLMLNGYECRFSKCYNGAYIVTGLTSYSISEEEIMKICVENNLMDMVDSIESWTYDGEEKSTVRVMVKDEKWKIAHPRRSV